MSIETKNGFQTMKNEKLLSSLICLTLLSTFAIGPLPARAEEEEDKGLKAEQEIKGLIDEKKDKSCPFFTNPRQVKEIIKKQSAEIQKSKGASKEFKEFATYLASPAGEQYPLKSETICSHVAAQESSTQGKTAASCRSLHPYNMNQSCGVLLNFLEGNEFPNKKQPSSRVASKKIKDTDSTCYSEGSITIDYEPCVAFAKALTLWKAGQLVVDQGQQAWMMGETQTAYAEAQGKTDDPKAALGAMKTSAEAQSSVVKQKAALETAKLAHLVTLYKKIPDADMFSGKGKEQEQLAEPSFAILLNADVKDDFKGELVKIGGTAVAQMIMAKIADDRVDAIGNAMAKVDAFQPIDFNVAQEDALVAYCQQHPEEAKCLSGSLSYNVDPFSGEVIQFGSSASGTSYSNVYSDDTGTTNAANPTGSKTSNTLGPVGTAITGVNKDNDIVDKSSTASLGDLVTPSGGGGGASAPGGGGGVGGGGGAGGQKQGDSVTAAGTGSQVKYSGGTGVSVLGNGLGIASRKSGKDDENPFGDLLGKNKSNGNGVLNLRGPASVGKKDGNIFEQISTRYREVSSNKERLLEYQQIP